MESRQDGWANGTSLRSEHLPTRLRSPTVEAADTAIPATVKPSTGDPPIPANTSGHHALSHHPGRGVSVETLSRSKRPDQGRDWSRWRESNPRIQFGKSIQCRCGVPACPSSKDHQRKHIRAGPWVSAEVALTCDTVVTPSFLRDQRPSWGTSAGRTSPFGNGAVRRGSCSTWAADNWLGRL